MNRISVISCIALFAVTSMAQAQLVADGTFDNLPVGTAPNCSQYAGAWGWPAYYVSAGTCEPESAAFQTVPTGSFEAGAVGNSLQLHVVNAPTPVGYQLPNILTRTIQEEAEQLILVKFSIWVPQPGVKGGSVYVGGDHGGGGFGFATDRGPQMSWLANGTWIRANPGGQGPVVLLQNYPTGAWLNVKLVIDLVNDTYDVWYSTLPSGPFTLIAVDAPFRSGSLDHLDRFTVANFDFPQIETALMFVDNVSVVVTHVSDINTDGHVDVNDLLAVISAWGACPAPPTACPADVNHNGTVDVNDLLSVITHWG